MPRKPWRRKDATVNPPNPAAAQPHSGTYIPGRPCRCGKAGFTDKRYARTVQREMRRKGDPDGDILDVYRCRQDPTHFHVGHNTREPAPDLNDPSTWIGAD